jgi:hypothetical protein
MACLVLLSEIASYWHLQQAMTWGHGFLGPLVAAAIIGLLIATIVGASLNPSKSVRWLLFAGGAWLLAVQALSVISSTALSTQSSMPSDEVGRFWGLSPGLVWRAGTVLFGGTLSVVTLVFWDVLAKTLKELAGEDEGDADFMDETERIMQFRRKG